MVKLSVWLGSVVMFSLASLADCGGKQQAYVPGNFAERCRLLALQDGEPGQRYTMHRDESDMNSVQLHYLGNVTTKGDSVLKFIAQVRRFGMTKDNIRTTATLHLYNAQNYPIGYYKLGGSDDVPRRLAGNSIIFDYTNGACNQTTPINFADSIPSTLYIGCTKQGDDLWKLKRSEVGEE